MMRVRYGQHIMVFPQLGYVYLEWFVIGALTRVSGTALCFGCGAPYAEHPNHPDFDIPTLHVACDGRPVKT
jgi:hypothetical protein